MEVIITHSLQGFHIYYGMYMVARRLGILFFSYFTGFSNILRRLYGGNLGKNFQQLKTKFSS